MALYIDVVDKGVSFSAHPVDEHSYFTTDLRLVESLFQLPQKFISECGPQRIQGVPKSDTLVNYVNMMSYKLQNTRYLQCLNNFNICYYWFTQLCAQCVHPLLYNPSLFFCSARWCTILLESPSVLTTLGSDIRQQSFTKNTFTVIRAAYFCSRFSENNASFAHKETITLCI